MLIPALYVDPTVGGIGIQILLGAIVGGFVTIKLMWSRFVSLFRRKSKQEEDPIISSEVSGDSVRDNS